MERKISVLLFVVVASLAAYMTWRVSKLQKQITEATAVLEALSLEAQTQQQQAIQFAAEWVEAMHSRKQVEAELEECMVK